jgi:hypothetical protein
VGSRNRHVGIHCGVHCLYITESENK